jgi:dihydroorotate dehydrogenase electron transfer subunit
MRGTYVLLIHVPYDIQLSIGALGDLKLKAGYYTYVGSALGGLEARVQRHVGENKKIHCQASLERWMKCGVGACSSCAMDPTGWMVCMDGPIANNNVLRKLSEFGKYKRNKYGEKIYL